MNRSGKTWLSYVGSLLLVLVVFLAFVIFTKFLPVGYDLEWISVRLPIPIVESGQSTFYLAQDRGYYANKNLAVSLNLAGAGSDQGPVRMVESRQDTFGVLGGPDTLIVGRSQGLPIKAIAIIHRNSNFPCLISLKESGIERVEQLEGKKVGFFYGHISTDVLRNLFSKSNVTVEEVNVGFDYSLLREGKLDAQWAFRVTAGLDLAAEGFGLNFIKPEDEGIFTHGYTIFAHEDTIAEKPMLVERFLRATFQGVRHAMARPTDANDTIVGRSPGINSTLSLERQRLYNSVTSNSDAFPIGYMDYSMWNETYQRLNEEGVLKNEFDVREAYTTEFLESIYSSSF